MLILYRVPIFSDVHTKEIDPIIVVLWIHNRTWIQWHHFAYKSMAWDTWGIHKSADFAKRTKWEETPGGKTITRPAMEGIQVSAISLALCILVTTLLHVGELYTVT